MSKVDNSQSRVWDGVSFKDECRQPPRSESTRIKTIVALAVAVACVAVLAAAFSGALPVVAGLLLAVKVAAAVGVGGSVGYALCINLFGKHQPRKEVVIDLTRRDPGPEDEYVALIGKNLRPDGPPVGKPSTMAQPSNEVSTSEFKCSGPHKARRHANQQAAVAKEAARIQQIRDLQAPLAQEEATAAAVAAARVLRSLAMKELPVFLKAREEARIEAKTRFLADRDAQRLAEMQPAKPRRVKDLSQVEKAAMKAVLVGS